MGWEKIVKVEPSIRSRMQVLMSALRELISHPDYNEGDLFRKLDGGQVRMVQSFIDEIENPDSESFDALASDYERIYGGDFFTYAYHISNIIHSYYRRITEGRSMELLESIAETFGVNLRPVHHYVGGGVSFSHRGLTFELISSGMKIRIPRIDNQINICVVDEKKLPVGDFYASLLGLIVAKPEELDVVNFGIQLGLIMLSYSGYHWDRTPNIIGIFTPFVAPNSENSAFANMLTIMENDDHDLAPDILVEIESALEDCFGSTKGFF